eukprot:TRINITY_DN23218_c0_g1_i1.p1 TRINITY_DN23218_c0_g1~~TRINITY_DN23218_c0_g1_i1.p1  ORF type:complete len:124 (+),score=10.44 TRINITY_DN23218_c0_g1_i1:90-461(+)
MLAQELTLLTGLRELSLHACFHTTGTPGLASIARALQENTSLYKLHLGSLAIEQGKRYAEGCLKAFAKAIMVNTSLRHLSFDHCLERSTPAGFAVLANAVSTNTTLLRCTFSTNYPYFEPDED